MLTEMMHCWGGQDEEEGVEGHVRSQGDFIACALNRRDIFAFDREHNTHAALTASLVLGVAGGVWMQTLRFDMIRPDGPFMSNDGGRATRVIDPIARPQLKPNPQQSKPTRRTMTPATSAARPGPVVRRSPGSTRERIKHKGLFRQLASANMAKAGFSDESFKNLGVFASDIDKILHGTRLYSPSGGGGSGRRGAGDIGLGDAGAGGVAGGVDDIFARLMESGESVSLHHRKSARIRLDREQIVATGSGVLSPAGRSRTEIMRVIYQNISGLRYHYTGRLRARPGLRGTVTIAFAIDEFGKVISCRIVSSTMDDRDLEEAILNSIRAWRFEELDRPGDITEVVHPFSFTT